MRFDSNFLSYNKLNSFADIYGLNHYKGNKFLEIYYLLNKSNTDYIEKKFLNLIYKKNHKKILKEISKSKISKPTFEKIQLLFSKITEDTK